VIAAPPTVARIAHASHPATGVVARVAARRRLSMSGEIVNLLATSRGPHVVLRNFSGYDARDLAVIVQAGLGAAGVRQPKRVVVTASPIYTRGCAAISNDVRWAAMSLAIASPSRFTMAKLVRIIEHEGRHLRGEDHGEMPEKDVYTSSGRVPRWAARLREPRYMGKAPNQIGVLGKNIDPRARGRRSRIRRRRIQ
jgi:hypothetical protein